MLQDGGMSGAPRRTRQQAAAGGVPRRSCQHPQRETTLKPEFAAEDFAPQRHLTGVVLWAQTRTCVGWNNRHQRG